MCVTCTISMHTCSSGTKDCDLGKDHPLSFGFGDEDFLLSHFMVPLET
jgi:hypothetical protein